MSSYMTGVWKVKETQSEPAKESQEEQQPEQELPANVITRQPWGGSEAGEIYNILPSEEGATSWSCVRRRGPSSRLYTIFFDEEGGMFWWSGGHYYFDPAELMARPHELVWHLYGNHPGESKTLLWKALADGLVVSSSSQSELASSTKQEYSESEKPESIEQWWQGPSPKQQKEQETSRLSAWKSRTPVGLPAGSSRPPLQQMSAGSADAGPAWRGAIGSAREPAKAGFRGDYWGTRQEEAKENEHRPALSLRPPPGLETQHPMPCEKANLSPAGPAAVPAKAPPGFGDASLSVPAVMDDEETTVGSETSGERSPARATADSSRATLRTHAKPFCPLPVTPMNSVDTCWQEWHARMAKQWS